MDFYLVIVFAFLALLFDPSSAADRWKLQPTSAAAPSPRFDFSYAFDSVHNLLFVFGGANENGSIFDDFFIYQVDSNVWARVNTKYAPSARQDAAGAFFQSRFYIIGGNNGSSYAFDEVWSFNVASKQWQFEGHFGVALAGGVAVNYFDISIIYFGGATQSQVLSSDVLVYYPTEGMTRKPTRGYGPEGREWTSAVLTNSDTLMVFGGYNGSTGLGDLWLYSLSGERWTNVTASAPSPQQWPSARSGHMMLYDTKKDVILFAGEDNTLEGLNDLWTFNTATQLWSAVAVSGPAVPRRRLGHAWFVTSHGTLGTFGGISGWSATDSSLNDVWILQD